LLPVILLNDVDAGFYNAFYYFGYEKKVRDWTVARELIFV